MNATQTQAGWTPQIDLDDWSVRQNQLLTELFAGIGEFSDTYEDGMTLHLRDDYVMEEALAEINHRLKNYTGWPDSIKQCDDNQGVWSVAIGEDFPELLFSRTGEKSLSIEQA